MKRYWRLGHRWLGLLAAVAIVVATVTGWLLMHPEWFRGQDLRQMAADSRDPQHLLAGGPHGLYRSTDGGRSWADVTMMVPTEDVVALTSGPAGFAVAFREMGVWRSTDGYIWDAVPVAEYERVSALSFQGEQLLVLSDQALYGSGAPIALDPSWQRRLHDWHTGWALGRTGARLVEAGAVALLLLTISGLVIFLPTRRRRPAIALLRTKPEAPVSKD